MNMTSRERVTRALRFEEFDKVPMEVDRSVIGFASDVAYPEFRYGSRRSPTVAIKKGSYIDCWGCIWECGEDGVKGEVKSPQFDDWTSFETYIPPFDVLKEADLSTVNKQCAESDKFMMHMWGIEPFQRMQFLRGTENVFMDLAYGDAKIFKLRDIVHAYYMKEVELWANTDVDGIHIEDDWGSQLALLISPKMWREYFKPIYKDYCDLAHSRGKFVVMHSDGQIFDIIPDMIEIGVDAVNAQLDCMDIEKIALQYCGKIALWGGFDRQYLLPFGTTEEVRKEVLRIAATFFKNGRTGIIDRNLLLPASPLSGYQMTNSRIFLVFNGYSRTENKKSEVHQRNKLEKPL
jgi:uroporphyrinogen decarboxylase